MGIFDEIKGHADANEAAVEAGIDRAGDAVEQHTGGAHAAQVDRAQEFAKAWVGSSQDGGQPQADPQAEEFSEQWTGDNQPNEDAAPQA